MAESSGEFRDYNAFFSEMMARYEEGEYALGLALAERAQVQFPENAQRTTFVRACLLSMLGDGDRAIDLLTGVIDGGGWYAARYWQDPDFNNIRQRPDFQRLRAISEERFAAVQAAARPELRLRLPGLDTDDPLPLLLALHGNNVSAALHASHWAPAAQQGWLVALPQSSQVGGPDAYVWDDEAQAEAEVLAHAAALRRAYPVDAARTVIGGFSRGGEQAIHLALSGRVAVAGFIAIGPGGPFMQDPAQWEPLIASVKRPLRGVILIGEHDYEFMLQGTERLTAMLTEAGFACQREILPGLGHDFPADFADRLPDLLAFVLNT